MPFMAVEILMDADKAPHRPSHDLESLFYVLIFICTNLSHPNTPRSLEDLLDFKSLPIAAWFVPETSFEGLATSKLGISHAFEKRVVELFALYFADLKPCVMDLFHAMYPNGPRITSSLTHDKMIEIFTKTLETLPFPDQHLPNKPPVNRNSKKHSLSIYDNCVFLSQKKRRTQPFSNTTPESISLDPVTPTRKHHGHRLR